MTNVLPFEQPVQPIEPIGFEHEETFALDEPVEIFAPVEIGDLSENLFEQQKLPIARSLKQKVEAVLYLKGQPMTLAAIAVALGCES